MTIAAAARQASMHSECRIRACNLEGIYGFCPHKLCIGTLHSLSRGLPATRPQRTDDDLDELRDPFDLGLSFDSPNLNS